MAWNRNLGASCAVGEQAVYSADTSAVGAYTSGAFTAPKKGIYRFELRGSGGNSADGGTYQMAGGQGGYTSGFLLLERGQTVYVGCGGPCSAAWAASANPGNAGVSAIAAGNLYFVAGAGGMGAACNDGVNWTGYNCHLSGGGAGGGASGQDASQVFWNTSWLEQYGRGGTQTAGGAKGSGGGLGGTNGSYGVGGSAGGEGVDGYIFNGGRGGDGYYGGGGGIGWVTAGSGGWGGGGGGGSGYVKAASFTLYGKTYTSSTQQGGGAGSGANGSVTVTYYAMAELPVIFNGTRLTKLVFNGTEVSGLIYDGTRVFAQRCAALMRLRRAAGGAMRKGWKGRMACLM